MDSARKRRPAKTKLVLTNITQEASSRPSFDAHQAVWLGTDEVSGLQAIIAIHDTTLGRALGGTRFRTYPSRTHALYDVLRLSRGMTFKAAIAGLDLGGGKAVIMVDPATGKTPALLEAYADMLAQLKEVFITAEDVGMTIEDADFLRERTDNVSGTTIGGSGNPAPFTALGVFKGIEAAVRFQLGHENLQGLSVAVQGLGSVGMELCALLSGAGAKLTVSDIAAPAVETAQQRFGAHPVPPDEILRQKVDVFAPCALGAVISSDTIDDLETRIVAGSANNILARHEDAEALRARDILYAPDYVINAGGLINVAAELAPGGYNRDDVLARIDVIPDALTRIFQRAKATDRPTNDVSLEIARERIAAAASS